MEAVLTIAVFVGLAVWVLYTVDRSIVLSGLKEDLSAYLDQAEEVVRLTGDPHYKAVVASVTRIYNSHFPART